MLAPVQVRESDGGLTSWADRRGEVRFPIDCVAKVRVLSPVLGAVLEAQVINASMSGARIRTQADIEEGMVLQVSFDHSVLVGEVRNCAWTAEGLEAGIFVSVYYDRNDPSAQFMELRERLNGKPC